MENLIGDQAVKIACFQVVPGEELNVKFELQKACVRAHIKKYVFVKGFGTYDIVLFYLVKDLGFHLTKTGLIHNILKSNLLLCYPFRYVNIQDMFDLLSQKLYMGLSLLKINPGLQSHLPGIDNMLRKYMEGETAWTVLGSLGWNEIIVLMNDDDIGKLCSALLNVGSLVYDSDGTKYSILTKTFSFLGINYRVIPPERVIKNFEKTKDYLDREPLLRDRIVGDGGSISPAVDVAIKPLFMHTAQRYFVRRGFKGSKLLGKNDLRFQPEKQISWSHFLASILAFRWHHKKKVFSTCIHLGFGDSESHDRKCIDIPYKTKPFNFAYPDLKRIFGKEMANSLANHFYSFNNLAHNPLCKSAFVDMMQYPEYIRYMGAELNKNGRDTLAFAQGALEVLRHGAELRSYGTYETLEDISGRFSEFRGGCQQALLASEFLPSHILDRVGIPWKGFVVAGDKKFFNVNEVINIPTEALWNPQHWWALHHEIAHIIIKHPNHDWIRMDVPCIQVFLTKKSFPVAWIDLLSELAAECVGFELGFFANYDLFLDLLWKHLMKIDAFQKKHIPIESYVIRSFFVKLFEAHFRAIKSLPFVYKHEFVDVDYLYRALQDHMDVIEKRITHRKIFERRRFLAAENASYLKELYPFASYLSQKMSGIGLRPEATELDHINTKNVVKTLNEGRIYLEEDVLFPEAVLYHLVQDRTPKFAKRIATIVTFWKQQMSRINRSYL